MNGLIDLQLKLQGRECNQNGSRSEAVETLRRITKGPAGLSRWALYRHRITSRRDLLALTSDQLRDIGLDYIDARAEGSKPFWRE